MNIVEGKAALWTLDPLRNFPIRTKSLFYRTTGLNQLKYFYSPSRLIWNRVLSAKLTGPVEVPKC